MQLLILVLALILCLTGCGRGNDRSINSSTEGLEDAPHALNSDSLMAPEQPRLIIHAEPRAITLEWQLQHEEQLASLYVFNTLTRQESLIAGDLTATTTRISIPSRTATRAWHHEQIRVELCDTTNCVSSERINLSGLAVSSVETLKPAVFLQGEEFADSMAINEQGNVIIASRPVANSIQIYLHNESGWIATEPLQINSPHSSRITGIAASGSADTLAILATQQAENDSLASIHMLVRLGEAWLEVDEIVLPENVLVEAGGTIKLSANGEHLLVHSGKFVLSYRHDSNEWLKDDAVLEASSSHYVAVAPSRHFEYLYAVERIEQQLWLVAHRQSTQEQVQAWEQFYRAPIQGLAVDDDVQLHSSADGSSIVLAGWESTQLAQRTPVAWRFYVHEDPSGEGGSSISLRDSLRAISASDNTASLRFAASDTLEQLVLGWHTQAGEDARISTYTFDSGTQSWQPALELPSDVSTLAKQGFAHKVVLSANGQTLLVSALPGKASSTQNQAGEILVVH